MPPRAPAGVVSLRVWLPRACLTRQRRGVWTAARAIPPALIQAVHVRALAGAAAA